MEKKIFNVWAEAGCPLWWDGTTLRTTGFPTKFRYSATTDKLYKITVERIERKGK